MVFLLILCGASCSFRNYTKVLWADKNSSKNFTTISFGDIDSRLGEGFDGSIVEMNGRLCFTEDNTALYPPGDTSMFRPVWLSLASVTPELKKILAQNHGAMVSITGTIDLKNREQYFPYYCEIKNISCICGEAE